MSVGGRLSLDKRPTNRGLNGAERRAARSVSTLGAARLLPRAILFRTRGVRAGRGIREYYSRALTDVAIIFSLEIKATYDTLAPPCVVRVLESPPSWREDEAAGKRRHASRRCGVHFCQSSPLSCFHCSSVKERESRGGELVLIHISIVSL